jgi:hypothetical protein
LVEHQLPKLRVAGSNPVVRSPKSVPQTAVAALQLEVPPPPFDLPESQGENPGSPVSCATATTRRGCQAGLSMPSRRAFAGLSHPG